VTPEAYKRPESVLIVVYTRALECLLLERITPPGFWQSVTGSLRWDETAADAAVRELAEETGLPGVGLVDSGLTQRFPIAPEWRARYAPDVTENLEHWWYLELPQRREITLSPTEHTAYRWLALDDATALVSSWTNRAALERLRAG
jgi:dATP pyrophosphohydrolase